MTPKSRLEEEVLKMFPNLPAPVLAEPELRNAEPAEARESTNHRGLAPALHADSRGGQDNLPEVKQGEAPAETRPPASADASGNPFDWMECVSALTERQLTKLAKWRGLKPDTFFELKARAKIGAYKGLVAFPMKDGCHYRKKDGTWRYTEDSTRVPLVFGDVMEGASVHIFESPWDALTFIDTQGEWDNVIATCGATNTDNVLEFVDANHTGTVYLWPQNDQPKQDGKIPGNIWANRLRKILKEQVKLAKVPDEHKDLNDWKKWGATDGDIFNAFLDAKSFEVDDRLLETGAVATGASLGPIANLEQALDAHQAILNKYLRFDEPWEAPLVALWSAHTWVFDAFRFTPYLHVHSPEHNSGKSRVLELAGKVARKPDKPSSISEGALYLTIAQDRPTLIVDEIDTVYGPDGSGNEAMRAMINAGFEKDGSVTRAPRGQPTKYPVFCPKAFGGIGLILPPTIESRCIQIPMSKQDPDDMAEEVEMDIIDIEMQPILTFYQVWAPSARKTLQNMRPAMPKELNGRQRDMGRALVAVAELAGAKWGELAKQCLIANFATPVDMSDRVKLLASMRVVFDAKGPKVSTHAVLDTLCSIEEANAPWASWWERDIANGRYGGPAMKLATMLAEFKISPSRVRVSEEDGAEQVRGYNSEDFQTAWKRYLPSETIKLQTELKL